MPHIIIGIIKNSNKTQAFFYYYCFLIATNTQFLADVVLSSDSLNFKFGHVKNDHKGFCFSLSTEIFNQSYIVTHKCCLVFKAQHIIMNILFAKLKKKKRETISDSHFPSLVPPQQMKEKLHPLSKSAANKVTVNYLHQ